MESWGLVYYSGLLRWGQPKNLRNRNVSKIFGLHWRPFFSCTFAWPFVARPGSLWWCLELEMTGGSVKGSKRPCDDLCGVGAVEPLTIVDSGWRWLKSEHKYNLKVCRLFFSHYAAREATWVAGKLSFEISDFSFEIFNYRVLTIWTQFCNSPY